MEQRVDNLFVAHIFLSFRLFCLFRVEFMICSNNTVTWETGCKQILLHPPSLLCAVSGSHFIVYFRLCISQWSVTAG